jgi:hypothetical protein
LVVVVDVDVDVVVVVVVVVVVDDDDDDVVVDDDDVVVVVVVVVVTVAQSICLSFCLCPNLPGSVCQVCLCPPGV